LSDSFDGKTMQVLLEKYFYSLRTNYYLKILEQVWIGFSAMVQRSYYPMKLPQIRMKTELPPL